MTTPHYEGPHYFDPNDAQGAASRVDQAIKISHTRSANFSIGPLEISADYNNLGIDFEIKLLGQRIGGGRLDQNNASASVGVDLGIAKASVGLVADFSSCELRINGQVCVRDWLGRWRCSSFNEVLLRW